MSPLVSQLAGEGFVMVVFLQGGAEVVGAAAVFLVHKIKVVHFGRVKGRFKRILSGGRYGPWGQVGVKVGVVRGINLQVFI